MKVKLLILALLMPMLAFAQYIDEKEARAIATSALKKHIDRRGVRNAPSANAQGRNEAVEPYVELHRVVKDVKSNKPCFYIYNQKGGAEGFAIVSNQGQLLARSDRGAMDYDKAPENVKWLLGQYQKYLSDAYAQPYPEWDEEAEMAEGYPSLYRHDIEPMVGSMWHQESPFRNLILEKWLESGMSEPDIEHPIVAGCTTIAMAQVMYYWKHPQRGTGTTRWKVGKEKYDVDFEQPIDWDHIGPRDIFRPSDPKALADLCYRVAASLDSKVEPGATSASGNDIPKVLSKYFDYDASAKVEYYLTHQAEIYEDIVYTELSNGRPCITFGQDGYIPGKSAGHVMMIEGYRADDNHFFINMGWGEGSFFDGYPYNAYYALTVKNGIYYEYVCLQNIISHIMPNNGGRATPQIVGRRFAPSEARQMKMTKSRRVVEYDKNEGAKNYHMAAEIFSNDMDADIVTGIIAKDYVTGKECVFEGSTHHLKQNYIQYMDFDIDLSNIEYNGYYLLRPVFRLADGDEWFNIEIMEEEGVETFQLDYVDVSNADALDLGIEIDFTLDCVSLETGETAQIEYSLPIKGVPVSFTSSDPTIVSVDSEGTITALQAGTVTITAHCDDYMFNGNRLVRETTKEFTINSETSDYKGIEIVQQPQNQKVYNLQGIRVGTKEQLYQLPVGLYIIDGKLIQNQK